MVVAAVMLAGASSVALTGSTLIGPERPLTTYSPPLPMSEVKRISNSPAPGGTVSSALPLAPSTSTKRLAAMQVWPALPKREAMAAGIRRGLIRDSAKTAAASGKTAKATTNSDTPP